MGREEVWYNERGERIMQIQSSNTNTPEKVYETTLKSCTCGDWKYRKSVTGEMCKHQKMLGDGVVYQHD